MKEKYRKRIDTWVDKHLGDLAPDVLSEEVKWKILFKIERKKLRKARKEISWLQEELAAERSWPWGKVPPPENFVKASSACADCEDFKEREEKEKPSLCSACKLFNQCDDRHKGSQDRTFCPFYLIDTEVSPHFCYECEHAVEDTSLTGKKKLLCKKWCYPRDPGFCGNFEERK